MAVLRACALSSAPAREVEEVQEVDVGEEEVDVGEEEGVEIGDKWKGWT